MNKKEFISQLAGKLDITKVKADVTLTAFMEVVEEALVDGDDVNLIGWGKWEVKERAERTGRNPQTGESITIPAKKAIKFKAGKSILDKINE